MITLRVEWYSIAYALLGVGFAVWMLCHPMTRSAHWDLRQEYGRLVAWSYLSVSLAVMMLIWPLTIGVLFMDSMGKGEDDDDRTG